MSVKMSKVGQKCESKRVCCPPLFYSRLGSKVPVPQPKSGGSRFRFQRSPEPSGAVTSVTGSRFWFHTPSEVPGSGSALQNFLRSLRSRAAFGFNSSTFARQAANRRAGRVRCVAFIIMAAAEASPLRAAAEQLVATTSTDGVVELPLELHLLPALVEFCLSTNVLSEQHVA